MSIVPSAAQVLCWSEEQVRGILQQILSPWFPALFWEIPECTTPKQRAQTEFRSSISTVKWNAQIVRLKRQGKENVTHKPAIESEDLMKFRASPAIAMSNPLALLRNVWFHVILFFCRRGREGQRQLKKTSFKFEVDASGRRFVTMSHDEATKNIPEESLMYPATRNWQECMKHLKRTTDTKLWSFTWPNSILGAMLSFSIRERILSGIMTIKFGSTPDQLVATNSTGWWKASVRKQNFPKCTPTTASEPPQSPYGRMVV